jgi:FtsP/CotA-like multicopper oxidase with cupredoxin domain
MATLATLATSSLASPLIAERTVPDCTGKKLFELVLTWEPRAPDGVERNIILVNGQFPAPTLEIDQGDNVEVIVHNKMPYNTTVHFHGIEQLGTNWADGVPGVTQRQILSDESFTYKWTATQYGSYWYHAHQLGQLEDGLYGPIVIHPKKEQATPFSLISSDEKSLAAIKKAAAHPKPLVLSDFRHKTAEEMIAITHAANMELPCFDSILFNGKGSVNCKTKEELAALYSPQQLNILKSVNVTSFTAKGCMPPHVVAKSIAPTFPIYPANVPKEVIDVCTATDGPTEIISARQHGDEETWIAIDLIGAFSLITTVFSIDEHEVYVYAVDGEFIIPQLVQAIQISNGDRYSVLVKLTKAGEYPIRVASVQNTQIMASHAILSFGIGNAPVPKVTTTPYIKDNGVGVNPNATVFYSGVKQKQFEPKPVSKTADVTHKLLFKVTGASYQWALNSNPFPATIMDHGSEGVTLFSPNFDAKDNVTISTKKDQWVDLILITATVPMPPHSIHKHGNKMWQIGNGIGPFPWATVDEAIAAVPERFNLNDPPHRDGFLTAQASPTNATWTVLRYHSTDPGAWLLHCHVQSHLVGGMALVIQDGIDAWPTAPKEYSSF